MNNIGQAKQHGAIDPMGGTLKDRPDHAGGYMSEMSCSKVNVPAGGSPKASMVDGPYGGKVKA